MTIFTSTIVWEKLRPCLGSIDPILLHFNDYDKGKASDSIMNPREEREHVE
jgi:hypothetical protein